MVRNFSISSKGDVDLSSFLAPENGAKISSNQLSVILNDLKILFRAKGYEDIQIKVEKKYRKNGVDIKLNIDEGSLWEIGDIKIKSNNNNADKIESHLKGLKGELWDKSKFNTNLSDIKKYYNNEGYHLFKIRLKDIKKRKNKIIVPYVTVEFGSKFGFRIRGNKIIERGSITKALKGLIVEFDGNINREKITGLIHELYLDKGVYYSDIRVREVAYRAKSSRRFSENGLIKNYFIAINEGYHLFVTDVNFLGANHISRDKIYDYFLKKSSGLTKRGLLKDEDIKIFSKHLREYYLQNGYVFCKVLGPIVKKDKLKRTASISYQISEGKRVTWKSFNFKGISENIEKIASKNIKNKKNGFVNVVSLEPDIEKMEKNMREEGYFFSKILNKKSPSIIDYSKDYTSANLNIEFDLGKIVRFNDFIIIGLKLVKKDVIEREIFFKKGDKITPSKIQLLRFFILRTNLFESILISVIPGNDDEGASLVVSVKEKKFGFVEIAPGYRSDFGLKLSSSMGYNNFLGLNHEVVLKGKVRQRLDDTSFDENRRINNKDPLELDASLKYNWPYFLSYPVDASLSLSFFRRKFYSFDDDIIQGFFSFQKVWEKFFSTTIRYQLEHNNKFNATNPSDEGSFSVASVTPGLTLDFRNDKINPTSGFIVNLFIELARSYLGPGDTEEGISYNKAMLRNASYLQLSSKAVIALSASFGVQKNLAKEAPLPSVKVFRLGGIDRVRGFGFYEINRYYYDEEERVSSQNIDNVDIFDTAYLVNVKLEPRYYFSDSFVMAPFLDMGKISRNLHQSLSPRMAVGMSWKLVTPVGALNFDYGIKLGREVFREDGRQVRDRFGQFHFTLGSF